MTTVSDRIFAGPGFVSFGVQQVVKFGGSLLQDLEETKARIAEIERLDLDGVVVFPGGGPTDNVIHGIAETTGLTDPQINRACLKAVDQTGLLLCGLSARFRPAETLGQVRSILDEGLIPVLIPSQLIFAIDAFTLHSVITSDTLGAFFAHLLGASTYVVATNVDGILNRHGDGSLGETIQSIDASSLIDHGEKTSIDECLPPFALAVGLNVAVVNGHVDGEILRALTGRPSSRATKVVPR